MDYPRIQHSQEPSRGQEGLQDQVWEESSSSSPHQPLQNADQQVPDRGRGEAAGAGGQAASLSEEKVEVRSFLLPFQQQQISVSVSFISNSPDMRFGTAWRIFRQKLKLFPYKPHPTNTAIPRSPVLKLKRNEFCQWFLAQEEDFTTRVIWNDWGIAMQFKRHPTTTLQEMKDIVEFHQLLSGIGDQDGVA